MADTQKGLKVSICTTPQATDLDAAGFAALTWVEIGHVGSVGASGPNTNFVTYNELKTAVAQKGKGITDAQNTPIEVARKLDDTGQIAIKAAALTNYNYAMKFEDADAPSASYTNTITYRRGLIAGPTRAGGRNEDFITDVYIIAQNQLEVIVPPQALTVPVLVTSPTIQGASVAQAAVLTAFEGVWTMGPTSYAYQWQKDSAGNGTFSDISGATSKSFTIAVGEGGNAVRVKITPTNAAGSGTAAYSLPVGLCGS